MTMLMTMQEDLSHNVNNIAPLNPRAYVTSYNDKEQQHAASNKWKVNTGFKKLQKRINERHKSGKSGIVTTRSLPPIADDSPRKERKTINRKKITSVTPTKRTINVATGAVPSELDISLYRTSNNGLTRMTARMSKVRKASFGSLDYSDSSSALCNNLPTATTPGPNPPKLPVIDKSRLLKQEVDKLDREHNEYFEEALEDRIIKWIKHCQLWNVYDGAPYDDFDRKQRSKFKHGTSDHHIDLKQQTQSFVEEGVGIIIKQGILKNKNSNITQIGASRSGGVKVKVTQGGNLSPGGKQSPIYKSHNSSKNRQSPNKEKQNDNEIDLKLRLSPNHKHDVDIDRMDRFKTRHPSANNTEITIQHSQKLRHELSESRQSFRKYDVTDSRLSFHLKTELSETKLKVPKGSPRQKNTLADGSLVRSKTTL